MSYGDDLKDTIHRLHGGEATHRESVPVKDVFTVKLLGMGLWKCFNWKAIQKRMQSTLASRYRQLRQADARSMASQLSSCSE
jgi:hypothetical protein